MSLKIAGIIAAVIGAGTLITGIVGLKVVNETISCVASYTNTMILCGTDDASEALRAKEWFTIAREYGPHITAGGFLAFLVAWYAEKRAN